MTHSNHTIGILGGTFDPIHVAHLRMAIELQQYYGLDEVRLIPCATPVHRQPTIASAADRLTMLQLALEHEPRLIADDREIKRGDLSYSIDTLTQMRQAFPQATLCLMVGIDAFLGFLSWHRAQEIFDYAHVLVAHRPYYDLPQAGPLIQLIEQRIQKNPEYIQQHLAGGLFLTEISALQISATEIRKQFAMQQNPRYLLPDSVLNYIRKHNIYSK